MAPAKDNDKPSFQEAEATYGKAFREVSSLPKHLVESYLTSLKAMTRRSSEPQQVWTHCARIYVTYVINDSNHPPHYKADAHAIKAAFLLADPENDDFKEAKEDLEAAEKHLEKAREMYAGEGVDEHLDKVARNIERVEDLFCKEKKAKDAASN